MTDADTDAWILLSVTTEGSTLRDVIAAADMMNHAIPTADELRSALGRLRGRGLVERRGERFALTGSGAELVDTVHRSARTVNAVWDGVAVWLEGMAGEAENVEEIGDEELRAAYSEYTGG